MKTRLSLPLCAAAVLVLACRSATPDPSAVETAIAQTEAARIQTALAAATDTSTPTLTETPTPTLTPTPPPTPTLTPPEGMAYVPDLIGMKLLDATGILDEMGCRWFYVAEIKLDMPEWQVFGQSPDPGSLIKLTTDRVRLLVAVRKFTPTPKPPEEERRGQAAPDPCGGIDYWGICEGNVVYWCEDNTLWYYDCGWCGGYCTIDPSIGWVCDCP